MNYMDSELYGAVIKDNIDVLMKMEEKLSVGDQLTPTNSTVLHLACQYQSMKCVGEILRVHESLLLQINSRGETALYLAAREGHYDVVVALVNAAKSSLVQLHSLENTSSTVVQILIRLATVEFETALHAAVRYNHKNVVQLLVKEDPTHSHPQNSHHETPLYLASIRCSEHIIRIILENCQSPSFGGPDGRTALHAALLDGGGRECVKLLLEKKKDLVRVSDNYGWTAFHYAAYKDLYSIVEDLVAADKSVAYQADKEYKRTALHIASYKGSVQVMKELVKYIPDSLETLDGSNRNILHIAVEQGQKEVIRFILSQGSKTSKSLLTQRDKAGNTPLHLLAKLGCYVPELMNLRELDWEVLDDKNLTPLDVLHCVKETDTLADQAIIRTELMNANVKRHWQLWHTLNEPDIETGYRVIAHKEKITQEEVKEYKKAISTHMIVAALIATVALTAGFSMPGDLDENEGPNQGSPILLRKTAFKIFTITDAIALLLSFSSLFLYFMTTLYRDARNVRNLIVASALLNIGSIIAMMIAFITGTYAELAHSLALAIGVCVISSLFFILVFYAIINSLFGTRKQVSSM